jgi:2-octaprenyl-6-methoxyphenol hydroxylase
MMEHKYDIVIAGGGMVGLSLALQLGAQLPDSVKIALVEGFAFPRHDGQRPDYHPSFDARSTALSYSSRLIYESTGFWSQLQQWLCPIETVHVSMKGHFGSTLMSGDNYQWPALGYVVENAWLGQALLRAVRSQGRVELISPARVLSATPSETGVELELQGAGLTTLQSQLLVVADGAASGLRQKLGLQVNQKHYDQCALIANIATARHHQGCAYERFTDQGPVAMLPLLAAPGAQNRSALVWTLSEQRSAHLASCDDVEFLAALQERFGYRLGRLLKVSERHSYPLTLMKVNEQARKGIVVMGNAAHTLHPVAGQGYNLALRDIACLADVLTQASASGQPLGDVQTLEQYRLQQQGDQDRTITFSDSLPSLFMRSNPLISVARDMALSALDILPPLKREFVRHAAGVAATGGNHG